MTTTVLGIRVDLDAARARAELEALRQRLKVLADDSGLSGHAGKLRQVSNEYSGLSAKLLVVKSAMAVLTASVAGAVPVMGQMAVTAGAAFGTVMATASVAAMTKELQKLSDSTGTSAQALQEWRLAARFEGISAELGELGDIGNVFVDLSEKMDKLGTEDGKDFAEALKAIGLNAAEIKNAKPEAALLKIGDALAKIKMSDRDKSAFLSYISEDAASLLPLLEQNAAKFNEIRQYATAVGAIQSDAQLESMKQTNTELSYMKLGLEGIMTQLSAVGSRVVNTLGPNIRQLFVDARSPLQAWGVAVDVTLQKFKADLESDGWGAAFSRMFQSAYPTLHQFVASAVDFGRGYGQAFAGPMLEELKRAYAGIGAALTGAGGAEALGRGMGEAMQPVIGIVHNLSGAVQLLISNWDSLKAVASITPVGFMVAHWDTVVSVFTAVGNGIRSAAEALGILNPATADSASGVQVFLAALMALLGGAASTKLALGAIGAAVSTFAFALGPLVTGLGVATTALRVLAAAAIANPVTAAVAAIAAGAALLYANWDKVSGWWSGLWSGVVSVANSAWSLVRGIFLDNSIGQGIVSAWSSVSSGLSGVWGDLSAKAASAWNAITPAAKAGLDMWLDAHKVAFSVLRGWIGPLWSDVAGKVKAGLVEVGAVARAGWDAVVKIAEPVGGALKSLVNTALDGLKLAVSAGWEGVKSVIRLALQVLQGDFSSAWDAIKREVQGFIADVLGSFRTAASDFASLGSDMLSGLSTGISSGVKGAVDKAKGAAADVYQAVKDYFQIRSPSRVMQGLGIEVSAGLAVGIEGAGDQAVQAAAAVSMRISDEFGRMADDINSALTNSFANLDFSNLGSSLIGIFKQQVIQPLLSSALQPLSSGIAGIFGGLKNTISQALGGSGGILGSITGALGLGGGASGSGLLGGITSSLGSLFGGGGSVTTALSGIGSALGGFASALGPIGIAAGAVAVFTKLFGEKQSIIASFGQTANAADFNAYHTRRDGGNALNASSVFGTFGLVDGSRSVGRDDPKQVEGIRNMLAGLAQLDHIIASFLPQTTIETIRNRLDGFSASATDTAGLVKERTQAVFQELPAILQRAVQGGTNIMSQSAEVIAARFAYLADVNNQLLPALGQLGLRMGGTQESALAAATGLADLMGGIEGVTKAAATYYNEFYSQEERQQLALANAAATVAQFNDALGRTGAGAIDTHEEFRKYIESLNLTTQSGREAYAEAMKIVESMDLLADTGKSLQENINALPVKMLDNAAAMLQAGDAVDAVRRQTEEALGGVGEALGGLGNAAKSTMALITASVNAALKAAGQGVAANDSGFGADGSHALGLDYVPRDGYRAILHKGEMVLTAQQAASIRGGGAAQVAVNIQPQLQIVVNNASSSAKVRVERGTDAAGNMTATLTIEDIEAGLADRIRRRKGPLASLSGGLR